MPPKNIITTYRLLIRKATIEDAPFIFKLLNSPTWIKHIGDRNINFVEDAEYYIEKSLIGSYNKNGFGLYVLCLKKDQTPLGLSGFLKRDYLKDVDLGYAILPSYEKQGFSFEAAEALVNYASESLALTKLLAFTGPDNIGSQKLLEKLGFKHTGDFNPPDIDEISMLYAKNIG